MVIMKMRTLGGGMCYFVWVFLFGGVIEVGGLVRGVRWGTNKLSVKKRRPKR